MDIKSIFGINKILKIRKTTKPQHIEKSEKVSRTDSVHISEEAKRTTEVKKYIKIVKNTADVRHDKVQKAKERLRNGEYNNPEVIRKIAERLSQKFMIGDKIIDSLGEDE